MAIRVLMTGASGYIAHQLLPTFRDIYDLLLIDVTEKNWNGEWVEGVIISNLLERDPREYVHHFKGIDAVVHLGYKPVEGHKAWQSPTHRGNPLDRFEDENDNVVMTFNVLRAAYEAEVPRVVVASSNHAADWYEHALVHERKMEIMDPYTLPLSDNFYGWAKASYELLGFLFACGLSDAESNTKINLRHSIAYGPRKMGVVMIRIGAPRELDIDLYKNDPLNYKRDLGAYISPRDMTQLFQKAIEAPNIDNEYGIPWQVVYGISNNTRAFWSLANARQVLGYQPKDDSEVKYSEDIRRFLIDRGTTGGLGRVGLD